MGKLLPIRHPNKDFFIVDVADASPKDDMASMEHPIFSLSLKPDTRIREYTASNGDRLKIIPSVVGMATIMDKDILLYCISKLVHQKNEGMEISQTVEMTAHEVMLACNWMTNNCSYKRFESAIERLKGTQLKTSIQTGGAPSKSYFGLLESAEVIYKKDGEEAPFGRLSKVRIKLSDWTYRAVQSMEVLTISREYFRLRRPLERRIYEIARKHVGNKNQSWSIGIEKLREKAGTNASLKKFRFNLKEIIRDGNIPDYGIMLVGDKVTMQKLVADTKIISHDSFISLRPDTLDKAQKIAANIGVSVFDLEREWNEWTQQTGEVLKSPDGAFIAFCKQKQGSMPARRVVAARDEAKQAQQLGLSLDQSMLKKPANY